MLTSLEIENFKGIASRQRIDFAPLTLLFGPNSAGKSTVLQALLYLHELIERGSADVDRTELGGSVLELGGFMRLVHRHETERAIVLRTEFATPGGLERFGRDLTNFPFPDLDDEVESAWLELTIRFRTTPTFRGPLVERVVVGVNGDVEPLVWLEVGASLREGEPLHARVNLGHRLLATESRELPGAVVTDADGSHRPLTAAHAPADVTEAWELIAIPEDVLHGALEAEGSGYGGGKGYGTGLGDGSGFGDGRSLPVFALARGRLSALPGTVEALRVVPFGEDAPEKAAAAQQVRTFLEMVVLGTTAQLAGFLRESLYIGSLRAVPRWGDLYERPRDATSWGDGRAAWQALLIDRQDLVADTNTWLSRLGADCRVFVTSAFEPTSSGGEASSTRAHTLRLETPQGTRVLPSEVGAGISQLIPVLVASLQARPGLLAIEQPELHVHPALQVGLGDLLIEAVSSAGPRRVVLVETHSEHLILRLLRRIRQTTEEELSEGAPAFAEDALAVLYVEATSEGVRIQRLRVDERGEFVDHWPKGFFAERMEELL
jgi:ABC-type ATPase involved in cell division